MKSNVLATMTMMAALLLAAGISYAATAQDDETLGTGYCAAGAEFEMLQLINDLRKENGLEQLELSEPLGTAASIKARGMAQQDYLAHISPDGTGLEELLDQVGYTYDTAIGENIAAGRQSAKGTFQQWVNSPEHREIMLGEDFVAVGIGRAHNAEAEYDWYWAAEFGGVVGEPAEPCGGATPAATPIS